MGSDLGDMDVDVLAAMLRADASEGSDFFELLAKKLTGALPDHTRVEHGGGTFPANQVTRVTVAFSDAHFIVRRERHGPQAQKAKIVRGIALSTKEVPLSTWTHELAVQLHKLASESAHTRDVLERFIMGEDL